MASMGKPVCKRGLGAVLSAPALCAVLFAFLFAVPHSAPAAAPAAASAAAQSPAAKAPSATAEAPAADAPLAPPGAGQPDGVQDKFRKLQKEMARGESGAATARQAAPAKNPESVGVYSLGLQILVGLAFVLILAVISIRLLKKFQGRLFSRSGQTAGGDILEILETCHIGTNQRVVAIRLDDEVGVLGVTAQGISLLTVLKQPAEELMKRRAGNSAAFSENLNKLLDRFKKPKRVSDLLDET